MVVMMTLSSHVLAQTAAPQELSYQEQIERWRTERANRLKAEDGWLSVAGLYWLKEGTNSIGTKATSDIVLPAGSAPATVGEMTLRGGKVTLHVADGVIATAHGKSITSLEMKSDRSGAPDRVVIQALTLTVIERGTRIGLRLYDNNARARKEFTGLKWFPIDPKYRVKATFVPYTSPKSVAITNVLGDTTETPIPGYVVFTLDGKEYRLEAQSEGSGLFINFRDSTSAKTTYPAGRFLDAPKPENGVVVLDFNRAYNPPCAVTPFATCPLAPRQNHLTVSIPAGEQYSSHHQ